MPRLLGQKSYYLGLQFPEEQKKEGGVVVLVGPL